jgi:hypothetical protein
VPDTPKAIAPNTCFTRSAGKLTSYYYLVKIEVSYGLHMRALGLIFSSLSGTPEGCEPQHNDDSKEEPRRHLAEACLPMCVYLLQLTADDGFQE